MNQTHRTREPKPPAKLPKRKTEDAIYLCFGDYYPGVTPLVIPNPDCPNATAHTPQPQAYLAWHDWAAKMSRRGFRCFRCPGCGLFSIWSGNL